MTSWMASPHDESTGSIYLPLDPSKSEIRVLVIDTSVRNEAERPICHLESVLLDDTGHYYEAISWCWGDPDDKREIVLNGKVTAVPKNAEAVIQRLSIERGHRTIWLDAICINQVDTVERASQVAIMDRIYSQAKGTLIWLGEDEDFTARSAARSIEVLISQCRSATNGLKDIESVFWGEDQTMSKQTEHMQSATLTKCFSNEPLPSCDWRSVKTLYSSDFFLRLWVVQEVILNANSICFYGCQELPWDHIGLAAQWMIHRRYWRLPEFQGEMQGINNACWIWAYTHHSYDLTNLLCMTLRFKSSLRHDKVYGLLGLLRKTSKSGLGLLKPDYDTSVENVYLEASRAAIQQRDNHPYQLSMLLVAPALVPPLGYEETEDKLPSWAVRFDWEASQIRGSPAGFPMKFDGVTNGIPGCARFISKEVLSAKGLNFGEALDVGYALNISLLMDRIAFANEVLRCRSMARNLMYSDDDFAVTFTSTVNHTRGDALRDETFLDAYQSCVSTCKTLLIDGLSNEDDLNPKTDTYLQAVWTGSANKKFFTTRQGHIGTGPPKMEAGDLVCAIFGSKRPLVLRREHIRGWRLVGTAYVQGVMNGELIKGLQAQNCLESEIQWFDIY